MKAADSSYEDNGSVHRAGLIVNKCQIRGEIDNEYISKYPFSPS